MPKLKQVQSSSDDEEITREDLTVAKLALLFDKLAVPPDEWLDVPVVQEGSTLKVLDCNNFGVLKDSWESAMEWTPGLNKALIAMLAAVTSTRLLGSQLWLKIIGPPSCGKSTLCEALSTNKQFCIAKSTFRGFHSGYSDGGDDASLLSQCRDKALLTKDGDTLLQAPNLKQILSEGRDIYDTNSRSSYRNRASKDYLGLRMVWILCGTSSLRGIDESELGERFLDCVIMRGVNNTLEDTVLDAVADRTIGNLDYEADESHAEGQQDADMTQAMRLTGGYVQHLRTNTSDLVKQVKFTEKSVRECKLLGKFIAVLRARPSKIQKEEEEREFAARLVEQLLRLAKCSAVVMNRTKVDDEVMSIVYSVAMDTARGHSYDILHAIYVSGSGALLPKIIAPQTNFDEANTMKMLRFLAGIAAVKGVAPPDGEANRQRRWAMTVTMRQLYTSVMEMNYEYENES